MLLSFASSPRLSVILIVALRGAASTALNCAQQCSIPASSLSPNVTNVIPSYSLPTSYPLALKPQDPTIEAQIRNTLSHYPLSVDGKNFDALDRVFTEDVVANYSQPLGVLTGLSSVKSALNSSLFPVTTQHAFGTQVIELLDGDCQARSLTYYTASHFGQGTYYGQVLYAYGQYQDDWVKDCRSEEWRIQARTLVYMGPNIGNLSVFT